MTLFLTGNLKPSLKSDIPAFWNRVLPYYICTDGSPNRIYQAFLRQESWIKFAIVGFKRPGALDARDWDPAIQGGEVQGTGAKMCR
jgi:hypothetical protein